MSELRIGIVGCGRVTQQLHLPALQVMEGVSVVALAELEPQRLARVAGKFGITRRYPSHRELVADELVDVVAVCVPASSHEEVTEAAIKANKHVFVEKPLALEVEQARRMVSLAEATDRKTTVDFNLRSHRLVQDARRIVAGGTLGEIEMVRTSWTAGFHSEREMSEWYRQRRYGGGALYDIAVHHADLWRYLLDAEVDTVYARSRSDLFEDQSAAITATMSNGALVSGAYSKRTSASHDIEIYGQRAALAFSCYRVDSLEVRPVSQAAGGLNVRLRGLMEKTRTLPATLAVGIRGGDYIRSYARHWGRFLRSIREGAQPPSSFRDGLEALRVIGAAVESIETGSAVELSR